MLGKVPLNDSADLCARFVPIIDFEKAVLIQLVGSLALIATYHFCPQSRNSAVYDSADVKSALYYRSRKAGVGLDSWCCCGLLSPFAPAMRNAATSCSHTRRRSLFRESWHSPRDMGSVSGEMLGCVLVGKSFVRLFDLLHLFYSLSNQYQRNRNRFVF